MFRDSVDICFFVLTIVALAVSTAILAQVLAIILRFLGMS